MQQNSISLNQKNPLSQQIQKITTENYNKLCTTLYQKQMQEI